MPNINFGQSSILFNYPSSALTEICQRANLTPTTMDSENWIGSAVAIEFKLGGSYYI